MDALRELYQEVILDHGRNPRNLRHPEDATCTAQGYNPMCGDKVTVYLSLDESGIIQDAAFEGRGCAISMASASMMTEALKGKTKDQAQDLFQSFHQMCTEDGCTMADTNTNDAEAIERLQVLSGVREFPVRVKCATLAWHTMSAAVSGRQNLEITTE